MKDMSKFKAVLFDMDGTLVDTEPVSSEVLRSFLDKYGITITAEEWADFPKIWRGENIRMTFEGFLTAILNKHSPGANTQGLIAEFYWDYSKTLVLAKQMPGADKLLKDLSGKFKLILVTSGAGSQAKAILDNNHWEGVFDLVISHDEYEKSKPNPEAYSIVPRQFTLLSSECAVVVASKDAALAGVAAHMYVIGLLTGNRDPQDLSAADAVVQTLEEAGNIIKNG